MITTHRDDGTTIVETATDITTTLADGTTAREVKDAPPARKALTIAMSESAPVKIDPSTWPVIASASDHDGKVACQANTEWEVVVREHADGRRIVYGSREAGNGGQVVGWRGAHAGYLLDADGYGSDDPKLRREKEAATIRAIRRVAGVIGREDMAAECIADLPAQEI